MLEVEDTVSVGDVVGVVQAAEMVLRIAEEVDGYLVELGEDGRLVGLQSAELVDGVAPALHLVVRDYCGHPPARGGDRLSVVNKVVDQLASLSSDELRDAGRVAEIIGLPGSFHDTESGVEPRDIGCSTACPVLRRHHRADRGAIRQSPADHAGVPRELEQVEGVGQTRPTRSRTDWPAWPRPASSSATSSATGSASSHGPPIGPWRAARTGARVRGLRSPCTIACSLYAVPMSLTSPGSARNARRNGVRHR